MCFFLLLFLSPGGHDLKGKRVASIRGTDFISVTPIHGNSVPAGLEFDSLLHSLRNITIVSVPVFSSLATVNFQSRSTADLHFFGTYVTATTCPTGYLFNTNIKQCQYVDVSVAHVVYETESIVIVYMDTRKKEIVELTIHSFIHILFTQIYKFIDNCFAVAN
jgi:hypothetical protein